MQRLRDAGNTLVVVEHDPAVMLAADRMLDIGPGPGEHGGEIVFYGTAGAARGARSSLTADYLCVDAGVDCPRAAPPAGSPPRRRRHPAHRGRGASTISRTSTSTSRSTAWCASPASAARASPRWCTTCCTRRCARQGQAHRDIPARTARSQGAELDRRRGAWSTSRRIGRTTRSNPASYVGAFDAIRDLFATSPQARERKYTAGTFSFNSGNGRCPACGGNGFEHVEMQFLSDVYLRCPDCDGRRFRAEILECKLVAAAARAPLSIAERST